MLLWLLWLWLAGGPAAPAPGAGAATGAPAGAVTGAAASTAAGAAPAPGAPPASAARRLDFAAVAPRLRFSSDDDPIVASVYSLPSAYFEASEVVRLLDAVHAWAPERRLLVLADARQRRALAQSRFPRTWVDLLETGGWTFSPWPRDPFSFTHLAGGGLAVLVRPNAQRTREEDQHMGPVLAGALPAELAASWGAGGSGVGWTEAPVPFHNGQVLMTRTAAWVSLHTLEPRVL